LVSRKLDAGDGKPADSATAVVLEHAGRGLTPAVARLVGTATALGGVVLLLAALALAWPVPAALGLVGALNGAALAAVALRYRLPVAHVPAVVCLAVGYLAGFHVLAGNVPLWEADLGPRLLVLAVTAESGTALIALVLCQLAAS